MASSSPEKQREYSRRHRENNRDAVAQYQREYRAKRKAADPERVKAENREKAARHLRKNKEAINLRRRAAYAANPAAYRTSNPERKAKGDKAWRQANPEKMAACVQRRRARKLAATSPLCTVTAAVIAERKALTDGCAFCGADEKLTLDHVVALNDGGLHVPSNLVGACHSCNSSKQDSPVEEWFKAQPFFSEQRWQRIQQITGDGQLSLV